VIGLGVVDILWRFMAFCVDNRTAYSTSDIFPSQNGIKSWVKAQDPIQAITRLVR
jgi:hypothetical protein